MTGRFGAVDEGDGLRYRSQKSPGIMGSAIRETMEWLVKK